MPAKPTTDQTLRAENAELRAQLEDAEEMLRAIRAGEVDALVVESSAGPQLFTLQGLDAEQNRYRGEMLSQVSDAVIATDLEERITYLNPAAERQYRVRASDMLGRSFADIYTRLWPNPAAEAAMWTALRERGEWRGELIHHTHDDHELHVEKVITTLRAPDGTPTGHVAAIRDITERKRAEEELARTKTLLETLLTQAPVGFAYLDRGLRYLLINEQLALLNGMPAAAHLVKHVGEIVPSLLPAVLEVTGRILATGKPVIDHEFSGQTAAQPGVTRFWNESWYPIRDGAGEITGFGTVIEEITMRKQAEEQILILNQELESKVIARTADLQTAVHALNNEIARRQRLEREILEISEREQSRLGQDLHDGLGQELAAVTMLANVIAHKLRSESHPSAEHAANVATYAHNSIKSARSLARGLYPIELHRNGLLVALEGLALQISERFGIHCELRQHGDPPQVDEHAAIHIYRIVQESVGNAIKHGKAETIIIEHVAGDGAHTISVTDNGSGFEKPADSAGMGLDLMEYRARVIGAEIRVEKPDQGGCRVTCRLPL